MKSPAHPVRLGRIRGEAQDAQFRLSGQFYGKVAIVGIKIHAPTLDDTGLGDDFPRGVLCDWLGLDLLILNTTRFPHPFQ